MVLGMDAEIEPLLEERRMELSERGIYTRKKQGQIVHTFDRFMLLDIPTGVPVVEQSTTWSILTLPLDNHMLFRISKNFHF